jgi:hypothetical protein
MEYVVWPLTVRAKRPRIVVSVRRRHSRARRRCE